MRMMKEPASTMHANASSGAKDTTNNSLVGVGRTQNSQTSGSMPPHFFPGAGTSEDSFGPTVLSGYGTLAATAATKEADGVSFTNIQSNRGFITDFPQQNTN